MDGAPTRLQQELVDRIVRLIHQDALPLGARINENQLAQRLTVSRSPIRAALNQLVAGGYLAHQPQRGMALVARPDLPAAREAAVRADQDLLVRIARDRDLGHLGDDISETELMRQYDVPRQVVRRVRWCCWPISAWSSASLAMAGAFSACGTRRRGGKAMISAS